MKVGKDEVIKVQWLTDGDLRWLITSNTLGTEFKLYAVKNGKSVFSGHRSVSPIELENKFIRKKRSNGAKQNGTSSTTAGKNN